MGELDRYDVVLVRAPNPGPFTLTGTNTWVVGRDPAWVIDPGPELPEHLDAVAAVVEERGGLGGIALTHGHPDHAQAASGLRARFPRAPVAGAAGGVDLRLADGDRIGPLEAIATPGHARDHLAYLLTVPDGSGGEDTGPGPAGRGPAGRGPAAGAAPRSAAGGSDGQRAGADDPPAGNVRASIAFTGDAVLGEGSVFITPDPGALAGYLDALRRLRERALVLICPGHGPLVDDPAAKLDAYVAHRLERERRLLQALAAGARTVDELLDSAWADAPAILRPAAAVTLAAHLDKLADEGRLPDGVERPPRPDWLT